MNELSVVDAGVTPTLFEISYENVIHDLQNVMTVMFVNVQHLEGLSELPESCLAFFGNIKKSCYQALKIVGDANDGGKMKRGTMTPKLRNHDVAEIVQEMVDSCRQMVKRKNINLTFDSNVSEKISAVDKEMLERILLNLLTNAFKFSYSNGNVWVELWDRGKTLVMSVRDEGTGFPPELLERINTRYSFSDTENNKRGSGLGLSIVIKFTELMGGSFEIRRLPVGTEVVVALPAYVLEENTVESKFYDDFYADNIVQIELAGV